jgi:thiol-disulfide isomerase/thioredoxin
VIPTLGLARRFIATAGAAALIVGLVGACSTGPGGALSSEQASGPPSLAPTAPPTVSSRPPSPQPSVAVSDTQAPSPANVGEWILYDPDLDVPAAVDAALAAAEGDGKRVLLEFGADWCPDCHVLASYLEDPRAKAILDDSYHVVRVDVGYFDRNLETANRYANAIGVGIPSVVILDADGTSVVDTAAGQLADSRRYDADDIVDFLAGWAP